MPLNRKEKLKNLYIGVGLLAVFFLILFAYRVNPAFLDEQDNPIGGKIVANGGHIYIDFISQHMPGMYYICMLFAQMGISTLVGYRVSFYFLIAVIWVFMYFRYQENFGKVAMIAYPVMYGCMLVELTYSTTVVAEHIQAQLLVVLFLEFLLYIRSGSLKWHNMLIISICIFGSIMMAFVSAWAIIAIVLGVFLYDFYQCLIKKRFLAKEKQKQYIQLIIFVAVPFILLLIYLLIFGNLKNMYYQAFQFNREVYPKYIQSQYGGSIIDTLTYPFFNYAKVIMNSVKDFGSNIAHNLRLISNCFINIAFVWIIAKKNKWASMVSMAFVILCGSRAFDDFHSLPYWAVTVMMLCLLVQWEKLWNKLLAVFGIITIFVFPYIGTLLDLKAIPDNSVVAEDEIAYYAKMFTSESDTIYVTNLAADEYIKSERMPAARLIHIHPWFMEIYQQDVIDDLEKTQPKVIFHDEETEIWSNKMSDYAQELCEYIKEQYIRMPEIENVNVWVRKDIYPEVSAIYKEKK